MPKSIYNLKFQNITSLKIYKNQKIPYALCIYKHLNVKIINITLIKNNHTYEHKYKS